MLQTQRVWKFLASLKGKLVTKPLNLIKKNFMYLGQHSEAFRNCFGDLVVHALSLHLLDILGGWQNSTKSSSEPVAGLSHRHRCGWSTIFPYFSCVSVCSHPESSGLLTLKSRVCASEKWWRSSSIEDSCY